MISKTVFHIKTSSVQSEQLLDDLVLQAPDKDYRPVAALMPLKDLLLPRHIRTAVEDHQMSFCGSAVMISLSFPCPSLTENSRLGNSSRSASEKQLNQVSFDLHFQRDDLLVFPGFRRSAQGGGTQNENGDNLIEYTYLSTLNRYRLLNDGLVYPFCAGQEMGKFTHFAPGAKWVNQENFPQPKDDLYVCRIFSI